MRNTGLEKAIAFVGNQKILANKCGRAQSTISDWLNGALVHGWGGFKIKLA